MKRNNDQHDQNQPTELPPFTSWDQVPLVADIETTARVLNRRLSNIYRALANGTMDPPPMPRTGGKTSANRWRKSDLYSFVEERHKPSAWTSRQYFNKARGR